MTSQQSITHTHTPNDSPSNLPWGDSINFKQQYTFRLYFQNINGIQLHHPEKWENIIKTSMDEMHCDIVGFCETCLNWKLPYIRKQLQQLNTKYLKTKIHITHSNNKTHSTSPFLPGGTLLATKGHWTGRIQELLHDPHHMGRWTGTKYILQQNRNLYVISAYRACRNSSSPQNLVTSNSTYAQQYYSLKEQGKETPQPRKQFVEDIIQYIHALHLQPDDMLILLMDANEQIGMEQSGIVNITTHGGLVDLFTLHNCSPVTIPTFVNGKSRIDYVLGTPNILPYIKQCGYLPFNSGIISDHRGMFLDLCNSIIDNKTTYHDAPIREIGRHSTMEQTTKYKQYIVKQFEYHNIASRAEKLYDRSKEKFTPHERKEFVAELNKIDKSITEIMLQAEQNVGKDPLYQSIRSKQISELQKLLRYWQITVSGIKNEKDFSTVLQTLAAKISPGIIEKMNEQGRTPTTNLIKTKELLSQARKDQIQNWKEAAFAEIAMIASAEHISPLTVEKTQRNTTTTRRIFAILRDRFKPRLSRGLTSLIVPDSQQNDNELYKTIHDQQEIENLLIARNIAHFGQAQGSPFTTSPIVNKIGYKGTNNFSTKIIRGDDISLDLHNMSGGLKEIIQILNNGKHTPKFSIHIDQEEFMGGFRKWREETATSPSGRHLGHYKALLRAEYENETEEDKKQQSKIKNKIGNQIFTTIFHIAMATLRSGETLTRWSKVNSSMIEKLPGQPLITKLRVIHLYEADYNLILKLLWTRRLTWKAHLTKTLHPSQAGSRPGRSAIDVVLYKEHKYLYSELTRTALLTMDNDAKACYDRIICNLAMLASQYYGMPVEACQTHAKTLRAMEFHLRTALGVSEKFYKHTTTTPVHGSGQGSCASPTLWLILSSILMKSLEQQTSGMTISPIGVKDQPIETIIDGFVDDTSIFVNLPFYETNQAQIFQKLQDATGKWSELISASGGKLELQKCFFYAMIWKFTQEGEAILQTITQQQALGNHVINITDPDTNIKIPVTQKSCTDAHKTLGVYKTTIGDDTRQFEELLTKSKRLALSVSTSKMTRQQGRLSYNMIYLPTITYCLRACTFSQEQLDKIQAPALYKFLPAMGWNRTTSRAIIHGPEELGGFNIPPLYAIQCAAKIVSMFTNIQAQTELGKLLVINTNWVQLVTGLKTQIFDNCGKISYIKENWLLHLKTYMDACSISFQSQHFWVPKIKRQRDIILMEEAVRYTSQVAHLKIINTWRIYFQATTLSDICDGPGKNVLQAYREFDHVRHHTKNRISRLKWPHQGQPNHATFKVWKTFLQNILGIQRNGALRTQLGDWIETPEESDNIWTTYFDPVTQTLSEYNTNLLYNIYPKIKTVRIGSIFSSTQSRAKSSVPNTSVPATVIEYGATSIKVSFQPINLISQSQNSIRQYQQNNQEVRFEKYIQTQPQWIQDFCSNWESSPLDKLSSIFETDKILTITIVIAESSRLHMGGYGMVMANGRDIFFQNNGKILVTDIEEVSPRRLALTGILSSLVTMKLLLSPEFFPRQQETILEVHVTMSQIVNLLSKLQYEGLTVGEHIKPDIDIILQIQNEIQQLTLVHNTSTSIKLIDKRNMKDITEDKRFDVLKQWKVAHSLAEETFTTALIPHDLNNQFPSTHIKIFWKSTPIHSGIYTKSITAFTSQDLIHYMKATYKWNLSTQEKIWWKIHGRSLQSLKPSVRQIIQKFLFDYWATNERESKIVHHRNPTCERCRLHIETTDHVIQCEQINNIQMWVAMIDKLKEFFKKSRTPPALEIVILAGLNAWHIGQAPPNIESICPSASKKLEAAYKEQNQIGWGHFLRGRISLLWANFINFEIDLNNQEGRTKKFKYKSAEEWGINLILIQWMYIQKIWIERNQEVHQVYKDRGKTRSHEFLKAQAIYDMEKIRDIQEVQEDRTDEADRIQKSHLEIENMHLFSLTNFVHNMRKFTTWIKGKPRERTLQ